MKKGIIIVIIVIVIAISGIVISQNSPNNVENPIDANEITPSQEIKNEPREFTIGLSETMGFRETP